jgi:hypothetical protein
MFYSEKIHFANGNFALYPLLIICTYLIYVIRQFEPQS